MPFVDFLRAAAERRRIILPGTKDPEPLAAIDYASELALKQEALAAFWRDEKLPGRPEPIRPAPRPRGYRTTTKRRVGFGPKGLVFAFPGASRTVRGLAPSSLDLPGHLSVYAFLLERIGRPAARPLAGSLNWIVVRGEGGGLAVILNVRAFHARLVRAAKQLSVDLQEAKLGVRSGFLYLDPSQSAYYLETRRPERTLSFKQLFGPGRLEVEAAGVRLRFAPTIFSQVNGPMLDDMVEGASALLAPLEGNALLDLYCGYGLLGLTAGRHAARVIGVDADAAAIADARANADRLGWADRARFWAGRIDAGFLARRVRPAKEPEVVLLDPPRQGTAPDVVAVLAGRLPHRVVHICCGTDQIPREVADWSRGGYHLRRAVPLDLFAGTAGLETMLLFTPKRDRERAPRAPSVRPAETRAPSSPVRPPSAKRPAARVRSDRE